MHSSFQPRAGYGADVTQRGGTLHQLGKAEVPSNQLLNRHSAQGLQSILSKPPPKLWNRFIIVV